MHTPWWRVPCCAPGDDVRISVQLIEAAADRHLWAEVFDRNLEDVLAMLSEVARAIANEIKITVTPEEEARLAATRPVNLRPTKPI